jgi:hypothetical protein
MLHLAGGSYRGFLRKKMRHGILETPAAIVPVSIVPVSLFGISPRMERARSRFPQNGWLTAATPAYIVKQSWQKRQR